MRQDGPETWFAYPQGFNPDVLTLGSMVLDYTRPWHTRRYRHPMIENSHDDERLIISTPERQELISWTTEKEPSLRLEVQQLLSFDFRQSEITSGVVVGKNGLKVQLADSTGFFDNDILKNDAARLWLQNTLSVNNHLKATLKNSFHPLKIWLLVGIHLMTGGSVRKAFGTSSSASASLDVPPPELTPSFEWQMGAKLEQGKRNQKCTLLVTGGERVWAAEWRQVKAKYLRSDEASNPETLISNLVLVDIWSHTNVRSDGCEMVQVSLADEDTVHHPEDEKVFDKETSAKFDQALEELQQWEKEGAEDDEW